MEEKVISVAEMREADRYTIEELGVPSKELMRRAAQGVFDAVFAGEDLPEDDVFSTVIFCGSGNNGGDGYALAEIMKDEDLDVTVVRVSEKFSEDGKYYFDRCAEKGVRMMMYEEFLSGIKAMPESIAGCACKAISIGTVSLLGIRLKTLSKENGKRRHTATSPQRRQKIHFGALFKRTLASRTAKISQPALMLLQQQSPAPHNQCGSRQMRGGIPAGKAYESGAAAKQRDPPDFQRQQEINDQRSCRQQKKLNG